MTRDAFVPLQKLGLQGKEECLVDYLLVTTIVDTRLLRER